MFMHKCNYFILLQYCFTSETRYLLWSLFFVKGILLSLLKHLFSVAVKIYSGLKIKEHPDKGSFPVSSRILQLDSSTFGDVVYCAVRTVDNICHVLSLRAEESILRFTELSKFSTESCTMTSVHLR